MALNMELKQRFLSFLLIAALVISFIVIFYLARGYRIDLTTRQIKGTGILATSSIPEGALVYIDEEPYSATNTTISSLKPGHYKVKIQKQGYTSWEKEIRIEKELITEIEAVLTPLFPELKPLTFTGAKDPLLSPDKQKILFTADINGESSLWLLEIAERPFNLASRPRELLSDTEKNTYTQATKRWSPDSQSVLLDLGESKILMDTNSKTLTPITDLKELEKEWEKEIQAEEQKRLQDLPKELVAQIGQLSNIQWSPDFNSLLYQSIEGDHLVFKVMTLKPILLTEPFPTATPTKLPYSNETIYTADKNKYTKLIWYPDSEHLLVLEKDSLDNQQGRLSLIEIDGKNKSEFFAGVIKKDFAYPFVNGTKIAALTSFNPETQVYNLYSISLR